MDNRKPVNTSGMIAGTQQSSIAPAAPKAAQSVNTIINGLLDSEGYRKRLNELLGERTPQFVSTIITMVNADTALKNAAIHAPQTIIQAALKAASYDLPVDNSLGFAYIVPFNNRKKVGDNFVSIPEAQFILGYKGMIQLALRTGCYKTINVMDVREGELVKADRLREEYEFNWIDDDDAREASSIIGYVGYFRLVNGAEKTLYMTTKQIDAHEKKNRKGYNQSKGWRDDYDAMARKTILRRLLGKWGVMSVDYKTASAAALKAAEDISAGMPDDMDVIPGDPVDITDTGEQNTVE